VVRAGGPTGSTVRTVAWQDLAAVVSDWRTPTRQDALAHLTTLSELVLAGPVVPLKFGTTAADEDAVRAEVLAAAAVRLRGHLTRLDGLAELHAYLRFNEDEALQAVYDERQSEWRAGGVDLASRIHLGEQVAQHLVTWRRARSDALLAPVAAVAREQAPLPDRDHTEERRAFLIPLGELEAARAAITGLTHIAGIDAECVGPLPAYNFLTEPTRSSNSRWGW
jgi:hypothetical protein